MNLLKLKTFLHGAVILAAEPAAEQYRVQNLRTGWLKKAGIEILQLRAIDAAPTQRADQK